MGYGRLAIGWTDFHPDFHCQHHPVTLLLHFHEKPENEKELFTNALTEKCMYTL